MNSYKTYYWVICVPTIVIVVLLTRCSKSGGGQSDNSGEVTTTPPPVSPPVVNALVHPGILNTQASLDFIRTQANDNTTSRYADYNSSVIDFMNNHPMPTSFPSTVVAQASGTTPTETQIKSDAILAYATALRWTKTGTGTYASQAIAILNGWASNFQSYTVAPGTNAEQSDLEASWVAPTFAAAAEIIRYYQINGAGAGWAASDISKFESFLKLLKKNYIDVMPTTHTNNWIVSAAYAKMAIGVFINDLSVYQTGSDGLKAIMPSVIQADGTMPELCDRDDCVHFQYSLTGESLGAEIARIQGDNSIYTFNANRISAGYDFMRKAYDNIFPTCASCSGKQMFAGVEVANRYYQTSNTKSLRASGSPIGAPNDNTFLGFTTYTHYNVPL
jgi:hypothetical protein